MYFFCYSLTLSELHFDTEREASFLLMRMNQTMFFLALAAVACKAWRLTYQPNADCQTNH